MKQNKIKKLAIICSGGNAPGMGTCVIAFAKKCAANGIEPYAFFNGFDGLHDNRVINLYNYTSDRFLDDGSALIGSSRCVKFKDDINFRKQCVEVLKKNEIDGLVVIGGEGSYRGALELSKLGVKVIAIPATIDNDVPSTTYTIGFDTCLNTICDVISKINDVFVSHRGIALIELMGRTCPDLTIRSGIANNATYMVTKYTKLKPDDFLKIALKFMAKRHSNATFLITEKLYPSEGKGSLKHIARYLEKKTGLFCRHVEVGYVQRGGRPSARDRLLANYMISVGLDLLFAGKHSKAICRTSRDTVGCDLAKAVAMKRQSRNRFLVTEFNKINQE